MRKKGFKFLSLVLLLFAMFHTFAFAQTEGQVFDDVSETHWAYEGVIEFYNRGIIHGNGKGGFSPDKSVTRAEWSKMMILSAGIIAEDTTPVFTDTKDHWSLVFANAASVYLPINTPNSFEPDKATTRADVTVSLVKLKQYSVEDADLSQLEKFSDSATIPDSVKPYIAKAVEKGLINGYSDGTFRGEKVLTKAEAVTLLNRAFPKIKDNLVVVNIPADAFEKVIVDTESNTSVFEENIREYLAKYFTTDAVDVINFNVAYKRSIVPSNVFDSMLYNIALDENGFVIKDESGKTTKTKIEAPDTMLGKYNRVLERGIDVVGMGVDIAKEQGVDVWFSVRMNDTHYYELENFNSSLSNYHSDKFGIDGKKTSLDFKHEQVREYYKAYILELCENYDIDGIELDFLRGAPYFANAATGKKYMSEFVAELSDEIDKIADFKGKEIKLNARVYSETSENSTYGLDVVKWVSSGDVDVLTVSGYYIPTYYNIPVDEWREKIDKRNSKKYPYTLLCGTDWAVRCDSRAEEGFMMWLTLEQLKGFVSASYQKGADGIYFFNHFTDSTFNTYYVDENGVRTQEYVLDDKLLSAASKEIAETGTRSYVNTCRDYSNTFYPRKVSSSYTFEINTGAKITSGDYIVIIGLEETDGYDENLLTVSVNGAQARQIADVVAKKGFEWESKKGVKEPVAEHVSEVAPRVMRFALDDLSVLNDGESSITIKNTNSKLPQKIKWLEVQVTSQD